jgi:hypothetical protein
MRSLLLLPATGPSAIPGSGRASFNRDDINEAKRPPERRDNRSSFLALEAVPSILHLSINQSGARFENGYNCRETEVDRVEGRAKRRAAPGSSSQM